jgi:phage/plasmid primase-like uncharacterized protein
VRTLFGDERAQFDAALRARNLVPPSVIIADGEHHRCNTRSQNGKGDGSYVVFADGVIPAGSIQNFQDGLGPEPWRYQPRGRQRSVAEDSEADKKVEEARKRRDAKVAADHARAASKAERLWNAAEPATAQHPYLARKQIQPHGVRVLYGCIVVPARDIAGNIHSIQFIDAAGRKRFLKGGAKQGHLFQIPGHNDVIYIAEGFATAATIHELTDRTVIVAFDAGNLQPVTEAVRRQFPSAEIVVAADDDWKNEKDANPGLRHARAAAGAVDGSIAVPDFSGKAANRRDKDTDFNDLAGYIGPDAVKRSLAATMTPDQGLVRQLDADPFAALKDVIAKELAGLRLRDRSAFAKLRLALREAGVRSAILDEAVDEQEDDDEQVHHKQVDVLLALVKNNNVELFHTEDHTAFAAITVDGHREICAIKSTEFRRWVRNGYFDLKKSAPSSEAMTSGIATIDAIAACEGNCHQVHLRVAEADGKLYIDLCDAKWRVIEVSAGGWNVLAESPVLFRRKPGMLPLPPPLPGGSVDLLRPFLNIRGEDDFVLLVSFLLTALTPQSPYPVLSIAGSHGGAKSTLAELLRMLVDPSTTLLSSPPREERELHIQARNSHLLVYDNVSHLPLWLSDALCRVVDGSGLRLRTLHTDDDEQMFSEARPVIFNGIDDVITKPDLASRNVGILVEEIDEERRRHKGDLLHQFNEVRPLILGALLDAMAHGLRRLADGLKVERLPRVAVFARWATACETACFHGGAFMDAYRRNQDETIRTVLEADVVATTVLQFMEICESWEGTAAELLGHLAAIAGEAVTKKKTWPGAAHVLSNRLRQAAPFLGKRGILVKRPESKSHKDRRIFLSRREKEGRKEAPQAPPDATTAYENNGLDGGAYVADEAPRQAPHQAPPSGDAQRFKMKGKNGDGGAGGARGASFGSSSEPSEKTVPGNGSDDLPTCVQCQIADGKVALFETDAEPVWLQECRRFWLKTEQIRRRWS